MLTVSYSIHWDVASIILMIHWYWLIVVHIIYPTVTESLGTITPSKDESATKMSQDSTSMAVVAKGQKEGEIATGHEHKNNEGDDCKTTPNP